MKKGDTLHVEVAPHKSPKEYEREELERNGWQVLKREPLGLDLRRDEFWYRVTLLDRNFTELTRYQCFKISQFGRITWRGPFVEAAPDVSLFGVFPDPKPTPLLST